MRLDNVVTVGLPCNEDTLVTTGSIVELVHLANSFLCNVSLILDNGVLLSVKRILPVMAQRIRGGNSVTIVCEGEDSLEVKRAVVELSKFISGK